MSMLFLLKLSLIEFDLSLASKRNAAERIQKSFALERDALFRFAGNDLPVVRIISFDQFRDEQRVVEIESDLSAAEAHFHVAVVGQQSLQFRDRFGRHDDVGFVTARKFQFDIDHRQPASIGRDERELVFLQAEQERR